MAFAIRIIGVPVSNDSPVWTVAHILWWRIEDFIGKKGEINDPRFRESVDRTLYLDYVGIFNLEEFIQWNDGFKRDFLADEKRKTIHEAQRQLMEQVDAYIRKRLDTKWVLVEQYEWETGMN
jgi:hypothetical protein